MGWEPTTGHNGNMLTIAAYVIVGLVGGAIAKALVPGSHSPGLVRTMLLGVSGALLGGFLGGLLLGIGYRSIFSLGGLAFAVGGAVLILLFSNFFAGSNRR